MKTNRNLYKRIMEDVSRVVKKHLNESYDELDDLDDEELIDLALSSSYSSELYKYAEHCKNPKNRDYILSIIEDSDFYDEDEYPSRRW